MRDLPIAYGHSSHAKKWSNKTTTFDDLCERLKTTIRTPESVEEYAKMKFKDRETAKNHGGFMCGALTGGRRLLQNVACRSMVNLDGDLVTVAFVADYESRMKYRSCLYSTHGHVPDAPRVRVLIPLTRDVTSEEYVAVSRYVAEELGIDMFDECSYIPNQMMYWPSTPSNGEYLYLVTDGDWLDPDDILSAHPEWTDPTRLPTSSRESEAKGISDKKQADPLEKEGIVGMFNNAYFPVSLAIDEFLSDVYELSADGTRYRYKESNSQPGVEIKEGGKFVYSHHAKDPAYLKLCSAFDIVRTHLFGDEDEKKSFRAMSDFASKDEKVKMLILEKKQREAEADFDAADDEDDSWKKKLEYEPRSTLLKNSLHNITLIMENDPNLKGIVFNQLADGMEIKGEVPWKHPARFWRDADDAQLISFVDSHYGSFSERNYRIAVTKVTDDRSYHPIREMFDSLPPWDKVRRAETVLIDYLGAEDNRYVRAVTRKSLCAAYMRVHYPGIKFDTMIVLNGAQGIGKSTLIASLGGDWFSDSLALSDMNDKTAAEKLQGYWILEIGELAGMKKADIDKVKAFISRQDDKYRASFGRRVTPHPRQCVFFGTTNSENGYLRDITGNRRFWNVKVTGQGKYKPWDMTAEVVQQIWAEVAEIAKAGEKLYLDADLEAYAKQEQREAMEQDDREGIVRNYLDMLLPDNWDSMDYYRRREYIRDIDDPTRTEGTVKRQTVSNIEIWCECFGKSKEEMRPSDSYAISAIMVRIEGWEKSGARQMLPIYGRQRVYTRTT